MIFIYDSNVLVICLFTKCNVSVSQEWKYVSHLVGIKIIIRL